MRRTIALITILVVASFQFAYFYVPLKAESINRKVQVTVVDTDSKANIAGTTITLEYISGKFTLESKSDSYVEFADLPTGSFKVTMEVKDYTNSGYLYTTTDGTAPKQEFSLDDTYTEAKKITFELKKKPAEPVIKDLDKIQAIKLPAVYTKVGSLSTDLSKLTKDNVAAYSDFVIDNPGVTKISFNEKIDLSNLEQVSKLSKLDQYLNLETTGKVVFSTSELPFLNKKATITMSNLRLVDGASVPKIYKDGKEDQSVSNVQVNGQKLSFDVAGFSTYTITPALDVDYSNLVKVVDSNDPQKETDIYNTNKAAYNFTLKTNNIDALVSVYNNNTILNLPTSPNLAGIVSGQVNLVEGRNRIRVVVELSNGEKVEKFYTINLNSAAANNISAVFAVVFFLLIVLGGIILGGYYYRKRKDSSKKKQELAKETEEKKIEYNQNLLTEEEKVLYNQEIKDKPE